MRFLSFSVCLRHKQSRRGPRSLVPEQLASHRAVPPPAGPSQAAPRSEAGAPLLSSFLLGLRPAHALRLLSAEEGAVW